MSRFDRVVLQPDGSHQHFYRGQPVRAPGAAELCQNGPQQGEGSAMWGVVRERRLTERGTLAHVADAGPVLEVLRQLVPLIDAAGREFGPSKADSIAALQRVIAALPPDLAALVRLR